MPATAPTAIAATWLEALEAALAAEDVQTASGLFAADGYWRDLLAFTWNVKTMEGRSAIAAMLETTLAQTQPKTFRLSGETTRRDGLIEAWFTFETATAHGEGIVRLGSDGCRTLLTVMTDLKGFEERMGLTRPQGVRHQADRARKTWAELRAEEEQALGRTEQPYCLVIGGGQGGIALGARLRQLGVPTIIVEKNARAGDSWRNRYRTLVLHDPVWFDHLPYIPFPDHWPVFTPKDQLGDWLEMYAKVMELDYWTSTRAEQASWDEATQRWSVQLDRAGEKITLHPAHLVFATGAYGPPRRIPLAGLEQFKGRVLHSSDYQRGSDFAGQRVVVVGAASSGHDVAVDLWEAGADVTMVQRSPTTVVKSETLMELAFGDLYSEEALARGITTEKADMLLAATPYALLAEGQKPLVEAMKTRDADFYRQLEAAGFTIDFGEDETGLIMKAFRTGSGYYIDVGASDLIIRGEIAVKSGVGVEGLSEDALLLSDGSEILADAVILCTGFQSMHETVAAIVSREAADAVGPCWGLGSGVRGDPGPWQGEPRNMYKPTAVEALWFHGGNLALSRFYSKILALQLKARMEGIDTPVYAPPASAASAPDVTRP
ncbi:MAG: NAD(P)/FAD-dependent oxidoreductase [Alphaproteobacteria bacterium]